MSVRVVDHIVFQAHPRTASMAIEAALGGEPSAKHHGWIDGPEPTVCVIRNPFDVMVSWFLLNPDWDDLTSFICDYQHSELEKDGQLFYHAPKCTWIIGWENLEFELNSVLKRVDLPQVNLQRVNVTPNKKPFRSYYTNDSVKALRDRYGAEVQRYGY